MDEMAGLPDYLPEDEIAEGYRDGREDDRDSLPASMANRSDAYVFGWLNGRDDRIGKPRAEAETLRRMADKLAPRQARPHSPKTVSG
jgi:hypothetical protein